MPFSPPGDLLDPGIKLRSLALQADSVPLSHHGRPKLDLNLSEPLKSFFLINLYWSRVDLHDPPS